MLEKINLTYAQNGDEDRIEQIFKRYKWLIYKNSTDFFLKGTDFEDIIQEGFIGLFIIIQININLSTKLLKVKKEFRATTKNILRNPFYFFEKPDEILLNKEFFKLLQKYLESIKLIKWKK